MWDTTTKAEVRRFAFQYDSGHALAFSHDGKLLAAGDFGEEHHIRIWDRTTDDRELTRRVIADASKRGADCREHCEVTGWKNSEAGGMEVRWKSNEGEKMARARVVVNASGPWIDRLRKK